MANLYHKGKSAAVRNGSPEACLDQIRTFLKGCRAPALAETGESVVPLRAGEYSLLVRNDRLWLEVWSENRSVSRRILAVLRSASGILDCSVQRFGGQIGSISFLDTERPQVSSRLLAGTRSSFAEQFRTMLFRQFPGWEVRSLSTSMDLQRSLSPIYPRAELQRGQHRIAALACPSADSEGAFLTFALLWFDYLRSRAHAEERTSLCLFLPEDAGCLTAHRLRWMSTGILRPTLIRFNSHGSAGEVDGTDLGNLATSVSPQYRPIELSERLHGLMRKLLQDPLVGACPELNGSVTLRYRGLSVASLARDAVHVGVGQKQYVTSDEAERAIQDLLVGLRSLENSGPAHSHHRDSVWAGTTECWMEGTVRRNVCALDPLLRSEPLHRQVITFAGGDRDAVDLLGLRHDGQLVVLELKGYQDIHLPMQGLDYWMRVQWHAQANELGHLFPGLPIQPKPARLLLIAPALSFHSSHERILRYFSQRIDVERIGIHQSWAEQLTVLTRLQRADLPQSQYQHSNEFRGINTHQEGTSQPEP